MQKRDWTWTTPRFPEQPARMVRWGHFGTPVLIFPSAGGDREEIEQFNLISSLAGLIDQGRIKIYSIDGLCVRGWLAGKAPGDAHALLQAKYDSHVNEDVLQRIREDCQSSRIEPVLAGVSRGAGMALSAVCRHPESFRAAIGLSGVYDWPIEALASAPSQKLEQLRRRLIILGSGEGDYENPVESRRLSETLGKKGVPCRLNLWGPTRDHTWATWRETLPPLLTEHAQQPA
jgi:esterase/lipase superfamily enzyme